MSGRTIAIGDIHGCDRAFAALIEAIGPSAEDHVIILGDFVDRGPNTRAVIDRLIDVKDQCRLTCLMGNHEEMLLAARADLSRRALYTWLPCGGAATLESYGPRVGPDEIPAEHVALIESCRDFVQTGDHVFVHASYDANIPIDRQEAYMLRWASLRDYIPPRHVSGKTVIVGHTSQKDGEIFDRGYLKCIDTYCYGGGWLTALEVGTGQLWQADVKGKLRAEE